MSATAMKTGKEYRDAYIRSVPSLFCPGCGDGQILNAFVRAVDEAGIPREKYLMVSGIGCAAWIPSPNLKLDTLHTTHGRAIAFATGAKLANTELRVVVISGDGDLGSIGGNHLLHAARMNMDLLVVMVNNAIYGMTGAQVAPTTPHGFKTTTTPYGNPGWEMDYSAVVAAAGATYVARWTTAHLPQLQNSFREALGRNGFSFIEVVSQCPTHIGKAMGMDAVAMLRHFKENSAPDGTKKYSIGVLVRRDDRKSYVESLKEISGVEG